MLKKRIIFALKNAAYYFIFFVLFDLIFDSDSFAKEDYWRRELFKGIFMFVFFLIIYQFKDLTWKDIFSKKKRKNNFNKS